MFGRKQREIERLGRLVEALKRDVTYYKELFRKSREVEDNLRALVSKQAREIIALGVPAYTKTPAKKSRKK